jgi:predicted RNase H-like HicB family nuclease
MMRDVRTYTIVVEPDQSGDLVVSVPALPGCFTHGKTIEECKERAIEAIEVHIAGLVADGEPVPQEVDMRQLSTTGSLRPRPTTPANPLARICTFLWARRMCRDSSAVFEQSRQLCGRGPLRLLAFCATQTELLLQP